MENRERICRFCFGKCDTNFIPVEESTHEILNVLLVTKNLAITDESVMCPNCSEILQNSFAFKKNFLNIRSRTVAFGSNKDNCPAVCRFCMALSENCPFIILNLEAHILEKAMLEKYFPELDLGASKNFAICEICRGSLVNFFRFITMFSSAEDKIKEFSQADRANNTEPMQLNNVMKFTIENFRRESDDKLDIFKIEDTIYVKSEYEKMKFQGGICTLCLEKCERFKSIDSNMRHILDILIPKRGFTVAQGPVMCKTCEEVLIKCFDFKTRCLHIKDYIVPFLNNHIEVDLKHVYLNRNATSTAVPEDQDICAFCMSLVENSSVVSLAVEERDVMLEKMVEQCLPELDLSIIKKPVICASCHELLKDCFRFVMNCLTVGGKIRPCEIPDVNSKRQIELEHSKSLQFTLKDATTKEVDSKSANIIKVEEQLCEDRKNLDEREIDDVRKSFKLEHIFYDDRDASGGDENIAGGSNKLGFIKIEEIFLEENDAKHKMADLVQMEGHKFLRQEEIEIKTDEHDFNSTEDDIVLSHSEATKRYHRRGDCSVLNLGLDQSNPYIKHTVTKKLSLFREKHKNSLVNHNLILEGLKKHKVPSEVPMYKCDHCSYQTKYKSSLRNHLLKHKDSSKVAMYKCDHCSYQTKHKFSLNIHLLIHKDPSEVTTYKCDHCLFQTKHKSSLKSHLLRHRDPSEVAVFKCDHCAFQANRMNNLKSHLLTHKHPSEVTMHKCNSCSYQTKFKHYLKKHLISHENLSEVTIYKCDYCSFQSRYKRSLEHHVVKHKDPSEVTMYKCYHCTFQTKRKCSLNVHLLTHKDPSEVTMYKCDYCSFETKYKGSIELHLVKHKDPSEVTMYNCDHCSFQTKHRCSLNVHSLKHNVQAVPSNLQTMENLEKSGN